MPLRFECSAFVVGRLLIPRQVAPLSEAGLQFNLFVALVTATKGRLSHFNFILCRNSSLKVLCLSASMPPLPRAAITSFRSLVTPSMDLRGQPLVLYTGRNVQMDRYLGLRSKVIFAQGEMSNFTCC